MEKLYTVRKNKTGSWLWLRSWTPYCQIQTEIEESRENHLTIQVWLKSNPWQLYSISDKYIQGVISDRLSKELLMEVHNIVQEIVIKIVPKKKKWKKAKWLSEEALWIPEKRREAKGKGENERYIHLNAEFQRIAKRDKQVFLSGQCKEIEEVRQKREISCDTTYIWTLKNNTINLFIKQKQTHRLT